MRTGHNPGAAGCCRKPISMYFIVWEVGCSLINATSLYENTNALCIKRTPSYAYVILERFTRAPVLYIAWVCIFVTICDEICRYYFPLLQSNSTWHFHGIKQVKRFKLSPGLSKTKEQFAETTTKMPWKCLPVWKSTTRSSHRHWCLLSLSEQFMLLSCFFLFF